MTAALRRSVTSLEIPNYRRYFAGQIVSLSGNWMQTVAEMWLILELTGSGVAVGVVAALQFLPILVFGAWGGVIADRWPKRRLLVVTQATMALPALALFGLTVGDAVAPWMVFALVFARGAINAIDNPTRQSFVIEMVGAEHVVNAVGLNSVLVHGARILGPAGAGVLIATVGVAPCFAINAATFGAMILALRAMDPALLSSPEASAEDRRGGVRAALAYLRGEPALLIPLAMMAVVGTLAFNYQVLLPLLGRFTFDGGASAYTALAVAMAVGSVGGALATGARGLVSERLLVGSAIAFGLIAMLAAVAPTLALELVALAGLGAASVTFAAGVNSTLQLGARPAMRGRVMALYSVVFLGSTPIGGPLVGWLAEVAGPRAGLWLAGFAALAAALGGAWAFGIASGGRRRWGRLERRRAVAEQAGGADQPHRLEGRARLDVEPDPVALLDRRDGGLAPAPRQRREDRVARPDPGHLGPHPTGGSGGDREHGDRPQPRERDPRRSLGRQAGRGARARERSRDGRGRALRAAEHDARQRGDEPPSEGEPERERVGLAVGDEHGDRAERRGDGACEQGGDTQQIAEQHQSPRSRPRKPSVPSTTRSASR